MPAILNLWVWLAAYLNLAGWLLSALHQLNGPGYAVALFIFAAMTWMGRGKLDWPPDFRGFFYKSRRRFSRSFPLVFLLVTALIFLGGIFFAPNNYDALTYRLPRILNWLAAGHWFWIPTINDRMNYSAVGWEWLAAPQFALFHSDRGLFLINVLGFLLMPGLLFSVFRQVGIARRVAWVWMWILPLAYGYATQAGGLGNDFTGAIFCLASVHFGLRARKSGRLRDLWLALLAAALMTGVKLSNLPLLLPCLVACWPALPLLRHSVAMNFAVGILALLSSAAPIMMLDQFYTGNWGGDPQNFSQIRVTNPVAAWFGNGLQLAEQTFMPPVLPAAHALQQQLNEKMPAPCRQLLKKDFPRYYLGVFQELPSEEGAGIGLGISLTLICALLAALLCPQKLSAGKRFSVATFIGLAALVALMAYMTEMGSEATGRLLLPYYPLLIIPLLCLASQEKLLRSKIWRAWLVAAALSVLPAIVLSPSRPLWPAGRWSQAWLQHQPDNRLAQRVAAVYAGYGNRNDALRGIRNQIPDDARKIGLVAGSNDAEYSLWRPFGRRVVQCLRLHHDSPGLLLPDDVEWIVVHVKEWDSAAGVPLPDWAAQHHAQIMMTVPIVTFVKTGADDWCLLRLEKSSPDDVMKQPH
jgi:hypothetical protein